MNVALPRLVNYPPEKFPLTFQAARIVADYVNQQQQPQPGRN